MALRDNSARVLEAFTRLEEALVGTEHEPLLSALVAAIADDTTVPDLRQEVAFRDAEIERLRASVTTIEQARTHAIEAETLLQQGPQWADRDGPRAAAHATLALYYLHLLIPERYRG